MLKNKEFSSVAVKSQAKAPSPVLSAFQTIKREIRCLLFWRCQQPSEALKVLLTESLSKRNNLFLLIYFPSVIKTPASSLSVSHPPSQSWPNFSFPGKQFDSRYCVWNRCLASLSFILAVGFQGRCVSGKEYFLWNSACNWPGIQIVLEKGVFLHFQKLSVYIRKSFNFG